MYKKKDFEASPNGPSNKQRLRWRCLVIKGKARRFFFLGQRLKLKIGYTNRIYFFLFNYMWNYVNKYSVKLLLDKKQTQYLMFFKKFFKGGIYNGLGVNSRVGYRRLKAGKLSSYKK